MTDLIASRRQFARCSVAGLSAFATALAAAPRTSAPIQFRQSDMLLELGANALARAADRSYFADGHRGAALVAASTLIEQTHLQGPGEERITQLLRLNWADTELCKGFPEADPVTAPDQVIGKALASGGATLREVGHDVIFAMHAMYTFGRHPQLATAERVNGVCRLIQAIKPWRDDPADPEVQPPAFRDSQQFARFVLQEALDAIPRFSGFGQGFAGHMLTFGQALLQMSSGGGEEWAESCRPAFCKYVTQTRRGPAPTDRRIADHKQSMLRPDEAAYWQNRGDRSLGIGHVFKYPAAYYGLLEQARDPALEQKFEALAWQIF